MLRSKFNLLTKFGAEPVGNYCALFTMSAMPFLLSTGPDEMIPIKALCYASLMTGVFIKSSVSGLITVSVTKEYSREL